MENSIPQNVKEEVNKRIEAFNESQFSEGKLHYIANFKDPYIYLRVSLNGDVKPVSRILFTGDLKHWDFEIYHSSTDKYIAADKDFPGKKYIDGSIEGAMKAGIETYYA